MTPLLKIKDLHVCYGKVEAVFGVSLSIAPGATVSVIGPNGAGKTTMLAAAIGLLPSTGLIEFEGRDITRLGVEDRVELGICLVPESRELFGEMSVADNLLLGSWAERPSRARRQALFDHVYTRFPRLAERRRQRADTLSGGERQMLALGRALMSQPRLMMLDEPSLGLAPLIVEEILAIIRSLREDGVSVLLVEQNVLAALDSSDYGYVLESGEIAFEGQSEDLGKDERIFESYLGGV